MEHVLFKNKFIIVALSATLIMVTSVQTSRADNSQGCPSTWGITLPNLSISFPVGTLATDNGLQRIITSYDLPTANIYQMPPVADSLAMLLGSEKASYIKSLGPNAVAKTSWQFSQDNTNWTTFNGALPRSATRLMNWGYFNGTWARYRLELDVFGCENPFNLYSNTVQLSGINDSITPLDSFLNNYLVQLNNSLTYIQNTTKSSRQVDSSILPYGIPSNLNFMDVANVTPEIQSHVPNFIQQVSSALLGLKSPGQSLNFRNSLNELYAVQIQSGVPLFANASVVGLNPVGCIKPMPQDVSQQIISVSTPRCTAAIFIGAGPNDSEFGYDRYYLLAKVDIGGSTQVVTKASPSNVPQGTANKLSKNLTCIKGALRKTVTGINPKCPKGYSAKH